MTARYIAKKPIWEEITEELNKSLGCSFTQSQVKGRWKTQLTACEKHRELISSTGESRIGFVYEKEFDDLFMD